MPTGKHLFEQYNKNKIFFETGSYAGDGIQAALDSDYEHVYSLELSIPHHEDCKTRFMGNQKVTLLLGDSAECLYDSIKNINQNITFWLDGHYSCGKTAKGKYWSPLMQELDAIQKHNIKTHTIIIDDMRYWSKDNPELNFGKQEIEEKILEINKNYKITYHEGAVPNDILVADIC